MFGLLHTITIVIDLCDIHHHHRHIVQTVIAILLQYGSNLSVGISIAAGHTIQHLIAMHIVAVLHIHFAEEPDELIDESAYLFIVEKTCHVLSQFVRTYL